MQLKKSPEDFVVEELADHKVFSSGMYVLLKITKTNRSTLDVVRQLAKALHIKDSHIGFAGMKDKRAITTQYFSIQNVKLEVFDQIVLKDCMIEPVGYIRDRINLGELNGNKFTIVVHNHKNSFYEKKYIPNYFGLQRFSTNNVAIGLHILRGEFEQAAIYLQEHDVVKEYLERIPTDFIGAIRLLPRRLLKIYLAAVQSQLFNEALAQKIEQQKHKVVDNLNFPTKLSPEGVLPLVGFSTKLTEDMQEVLTKYNLTPRSFIIRSIPELSSEGILREMRAELKNLSIEQIDETTWRICFSLPSSSYATIAVKALCVASE